MHNIWKKLWSITTSNVYDSLLRVKKFLATCAWEFVSVLPIRSRNHLIKKQLQAPNIYSYMVIDKNGKILEQQTAVCSKHRAHVKLLKRLLDIQKKYLEMAKGTFKKIPHISSQQRRKMLKDQDYKCAHCHEKFTEMSTVVLDHCHYDNEINTLLHSKCNVSRAWKKRTPVRNRQKAFPLISQVMPALFR